MAILSMMMPGKDGLALTRALREYSDMPILFLSERG